VQIRVLVGRLAAIVAGLAAAAIAVNAQAAFAGTAPSLTESGPGCITSSAGQVCGDLFAGSAPLAPGGPAAIRQAILTFTGSHASSSAGLFLGGFTSRGAASNPLCTASDPGSKFDFTVAAGGKVLYRGTLTGFAAAHSDPATRLQLPGAAGLADRWAPGDTVTVELAMTLDQSADNSFMGCTTDAVFTWFAE
jgi:hypothetical protein